MVSVRGTLIRLLFNSVVSIPPAYTLYWNSCEFRFTLIVAARVLRPCLTVNGLPAQI
jgi:hypothetical protein